MFLYVLAFLEDKFAHLLTPFRDGEPGSPYSIKDYAESLDEPPFRLANYEYERAIGGELTVLSLSMKRISLEESPIAESNYPCWSKQSKRAKKCR